MLFHSFLLTKRCEEEIKKGEARLLSLSLYIYIYLSLSLSLSPSLPPSLSLFFLFPSLPPVCPTREVWIFVFFFFGGCIFLPYPCSCLSSTICLCLCLCLCLLLFFPLSLSLLSSFSIFFWYVYSLSMHRKHRSSTSVFGSFFSAHVLVSLQPFIIFTPQTCFAFVRQDALRWQQVNKHIVSIF